MKNLVPSLENIGLSNEQALSSLQVIYSWMEDHYPVLAVTARKPLQDAFPEFFKLRQSSHESS